MSTPQPVLRLRPQRKEREARTGLCLGTSERWLRAFLASVLVLNRSFLESCPISDPLPRCLDSSNTFQNVRASTEETHRAPGRGGGAGALTVALYLMSVPQVSTT